MRCSQKPLLWLFALPKYHGSQLTNLLTALIYHSVEVDNWDNEPTESNNQAFSPLVRQCRQEKKGSPPYSSIFPHEKALSKGQVTRSADADYLTAHC